MNTVWFHGMLYFWSQVHVQVLDTSSEGAHGGLRTLRSLIKSEEVTHVDQKKKEIACKLSAAAWAFLSVCYCTLLPTPGFCVFTSCVETAVHVHSPTAVRAPDLCVSVEQTPKIHNLCFLCNDNEKKRHISALKPSSSWPVFSLLLLLLFLCEVEKRALTAVSWITVVHMIDLQQQQQTAEQRDTPQLKSH